MLAVTWQKINTLNPDEGTTVCVGTSSLFFMLLFFVKFSHNVVIDLAERFKALGRDKD